MVYKRDDGISEKFVTYFEDSNNPSVFRHFKGQDYLIITFAKDSENLKEVIVYQALYGEKICYVREAKEFFSLVDHDKYPNILTKYRYTLVK